uniref:integumentary mucin C.1-like n=1 Tax=Scatophagus argus TaxID=75038 RepID=UPI001ED84C6F|nr:integumentary mucin C.1-like [Scatophagus argus]
MPAAMHLTILLSLFAVCTGTTTSSVTEQVIDTTTVTAQSTSVAVTKKNDVSLSTVTTANHTQRPPMATHQITTAASPENVSSSTPPSTSPQTPERTEETHPGPPAQTTTINQTSSETVSHGPTNTTTTVNTTSPGLSHDWNKDDLAANPGLVAILCIFGIICVLVLVVVVVKCIQSPRSNFERLDDVPMEKVSEKSPFAQYSK